jgi:hypothetical protein
VAYGGDVDDDQPFLPDEDVVSVATLDELADSAAPLTTTLFAFIRGRGLDDLPTMNESTVAAVSALHHDGDLPAEAALGAVPREVVADACARAGLTGYRFARVLLRTEERDVRWPAGDGEDPYEPVGRMALGFGYPRRWGEWSIDTLRTLVASTGYDDPSPEEPIGSSASVAFDHAVAIALVEHDRWLGRTPGN